MFESGGYSAGFRQKKRLIHPSIRQSPQCPVSPSRKRGTGNKEEQARGFPEDARACRCPGRTQSASSSRPGTTGQGQRQPEPGQEMGFYCEHGTLMSEHCC